jgi:glycosyltransferase involved in cell wall biosynthesis
MRVGIVSAPFFPIPPEKYGGTERVIQHLLKGLKQTDVEVVLFAAGDSQVDCELIPIVEKSRRFVDSKKLWETEQKHWVETVRKHTLELIAQNEQRLDIIHTHWDGLRYSGKLPELITLHGPVTFDNMPTYLQLAAADEDTYFNSISFMQGETYSFLGEKLVANIYNGLDPEDFPTVLEPEDYVCWIGRFDRDKMPHLAIKAAIALNIKIKVAGKIDFYGEDYFESECKPLLDHPLVEYLGEVGFADKVDIMSKAKVNLHPITFSEPFGLTVLEAGYCGTPTIAVNRGSMSEVIEQSKSGIVVDDFVEAYDQFQLACNLNREVVAQSFRNRFNYYRMGNEYAEAYRKILEIDSQKRDTKE